MDAHLGEVAIDRVCDLLGVAAGATRANSGFSWSLWGARQRIWAEHTSDLGYPAWKLHLRTHALEGFSGSPAQSVTLSARLMQPTLAGLLQSTEDPSRLELASSLEVHGSNLSWIPSVLALAARVQAIEARGLSESRELTWVGLAPAVNTGDELPRGFVLTPDDVLLGGLEQELDGSAWPRKEIAECADVLVLRARAEVVRTSGNLSTTLLLDSTHGPRCILEATPDAMHPLLGRGLSVELRTPSLSGPLNAIVANALDFGPLATADALGGWWATHGGVLRYTGFYPDAFYRKGFALQLLFGNARRARHQFGRIAAR
jgi:hypothetical protein